VTQQLLLFLVPLSVLNPGP